MLHGMFDQDPYDLEDRYDQEQVLNNSPFLTTANNRCLQLAAGYADSFLV